MATKAAKSITINATKYELANTLDVANGKLQLKAKDVVLDETEVKAGASWITVSFEYDDGQFLIKSIDSSDDIDPTTYTAMDLYNDWIKGDLKVVLFDKGNSRGYLANQVQDSPEYEGELVHYIYVDAGGTEIDKSSNDKSVYNVGLQVLVGTDTISTWTTTKNRASRWEKLCNWS